MNEMLPLAEEHRERAGVTDDVVARADDLQHDADEVPCLTACPDGVPIRIDELVGEAAPVIRSSRPEPD